ncbi:MAG: efflux RND transporter permease subunit, partial [Rhodoferax sp.]
WLMWLLGYNLSVAVAVGFIALAGVATGTGSEVMSRIAAPMVGGMISSTVLTLAVIPAIYALVKQWRLKRGMEG